MHVCEKHGMDDGDRSVLNISVCLKLVLSISMKLARGSLYDDMRQCLKGDLVYHKFTIQQVLAR